MKDVLLTVIARTVQIIFGIVFATSLIFYAYDLAFGDHHTRLYDDDEMNSCSVSFRGECQ
jgi:hypothetical protein